MVLDSGKIYSNFKSVMTNKIPFSFINWDLVEKEEQKGETGFAKSQTLQFNNITIRVVEYSENFLSDHWCTKGHIVYCIEGEFICELLTGEKYTLSKGMSFIVSDDLSTHKSYSKNGATIFIVDSITARN
jgi:mannose-6-phosphate isomerase class I